MFATRRRCDPAAAEVFSARRGPFGSGSARWCRGSWELKLQPQRERGLMMMMSRRDRREEEVKRGEEEKEEKKK